MVEKLKALRSQIDRDEVEQTFMEGLGGIYLDDILLRFLRATQWNVDQALERCKTTLDWRRNFQETGVATVKRSECQDQLDTGIMFFCGTDRFGHPLAYVRVRLYNPKKFDQAAIRRVTVWSFEAGRAMLRPPVQMASLVFDMTGFGLSNMDYDYTKFLIATFRDFYPESLGVALVVNAPFIFKGCWKLIKGWLDPNTVSKIHFVSKKEMTKYIPLSQLHVDYGGTRDTDPFPQDAPLPGSEIAKQLLASAPPLIESVDQQYEDLVAERANAAHAIVKA